MPFVRDGRCRSVGGRAPPSICGSCRSATASRSVSRCSKSSATPASRPTVERPRVRVVACDRGPRDRGARPPRHGSARARRVVDRTGHRLGRRARRRGRAARLAGGDQRRGHGGHLRFHPGALASLLGATVMAFASMPPVIVVIVVTAVVRVVVDVGERPTARSADGAATEPVAATARITWSQLQARVPSSGVTGS